jgi:hypothetical protein
MRCARALVLVLAIVATSPVAAQDSTVRIFDSSLNKLANRVQPVTLSGMHRASVWIFGQEVTLCYAPYTATLSQLRFATSPATIQITGRVDARWCNLSFSANLNTTADATYSPGQRAIVVVVSPTSVRPRFNVLGFDVDLPVSINVAPSLSIPPLPIGVAEIGLQGVRGPVTLRLQPQNVSLVRGSGYLELRSDVTIW